MGLLEQQHKLHPSVDLQCDLDKLKQGIALIHIQSTAKNIMFSKQRLYEFRDCPEKNLAQILADCSVKDPNPQMLQHDCLYTNGTAGKLQIFSNYYKELYASEPVPAQVIADFMKVTELTQ